MRGSPFTRICQQLHAPRGRADLHAHTTFSDGTMSPAELVARAHQAGLSAIAITDHDTTAGVIPARTAAPATLEVIAGVEITTEYRDRELHLLGYFVELEHVELQAALERVRQGRRHRAREMASRLRDLGADIVAEIDRFPDEISMGRRHLARGLIERGHASTLHGAFERWLLRDEVATVPKVRLPVAEAIAVVRAASGIASWAHPPADTDLRSLEELKSFGLGAVECEYPWPSRSQGARLRQLAGVCGLEVTGGSDSHDPGPSSRAVGTRAITMKELDRLRPGRVP